jgi:hypothetical protein
MRQLWFRQVVPIAASVLVVSSTFVAHARSTDTLWMLRDGRPENFFSSISGTDKSVCQTVLQSLNKGYLLPKARRNVSNRNLVADVLLASDLQLPWRRRHFDGPDLIIRADVDFSSVDLANDGHPRVIYRWAQASRMAGYWNDLFLPPTTVDEVTSAAPLPEDIFQKLAGPNEENRLMIEKGLPIEVRRSKDFPNSPLFALNIVQVDGRALLIGAGALEATLAVERSPQPFGVFVMEYHSKENIALVCRFRGGKHSH